MELLFEIGVPEPEPGEQGSNAIGPHLGDGFDLFLYRMILVYKGSELTHIAHSRGA